MRKIPIFVSCPTKLNDEQELKRLVIMKLLDDLQMEPRALGLGDYPKDYPLKEVYVVAKHCSGGIILGFEQIFVEKGIRKRNTKDEIKFPSLESTDSILIPTPWNNLEAGILFGLKMPLLIFKEDGIEGGVFDHGITDVFVHNMPPAEENKEKYDELKQVFLKWQGEVSRRYFEY